ncbi:MAG: aminotransferase class I/II-fold pyridoxal phosphate-dependent enzyme [Methyloglobulus sp.]|nr:aminotransferase class I/II-fold pyridoxal phosphate-dependent enzyme [Methyloglobulus sp.]
MSALNPDYTRILNFISRSCDLGIIQLKDESDTYDGRVLTINGKQVISFGNCSYLGLDTCESIKQGGIDAITRYGNFFSSSRQYMGLALNEELEGLLNQITGYYTLVTQTTSLGSLSAIPVITSPKDLIVLDHQVHASVQNATKIAQAQGTQVGMVRHSNMLALEDVIQKQQHKYEKIWYMADGMYSMLGDPCPIEAMYELMERYPNFHCFVDDAHGISWIGENGKGWTLHKRPLHPQMVLVMSMAKGFGCCGGILVFPSEETRHLVKCLGASLIYSGPIPTPVLGGCIASAKLHLTDEITERQNALYARIKFFREQAYAAGLPLVNHSFSPIFYFGAGSEENAYVVVRTMLDAGYFAGICNYPVVPKKHAGIRMSITTHNTFEDIENAVSAMAEIFDGLEREGKLDKDKIYHDFRALEVR